jgi:hypothetical protein
MVGGDEEWSSIAPDSPARRLLRRAVGDSSRLSPSCGPRDDVWEPAPTTDSRHNRCPIVDVRLPRCPGALGEY